MTILNKIASAGLIAGGTAGAAVVATSAGGVQYAETALNNSGLIADKARESHGTLMGADRFETTSNLMEHAQELGLNNHDMVAFSSYYSELLHSHGQEAIGSTQALISHMQGEGSELGEKVANLANNVSTVSLEKGSTLVNLADKWGSVSHFVGVQLPEIAKTEMHAIANHIPEPLKVDSHGLGADTAVETVSAELAGLEIMAVAGLGVGVGVVGKKLFERFYKGFDGDFNTIAAEFDAANKADLDMIEVKPSSVTFDHPAPAAAH